MQSEIKMLFIFTLNCNYFVYIVMVNENDILRFNNALPFTKRLHLHYVIRLPNNGGWILSSCHKWGQ